MANLWLWFPDAQKRREYVIELLGLESTEREVLAEQEQCLADLDAGKTYSPWFCVEGNFYMNMTEKYQWQRQPFQAYPVWEKGFRRIYTQKSYCFRPGHWLVLQLRDNMVGKLVRKKVEQTFPQERIGTNVPLPREAKMFLQLREVRGYLKTYAYWLDQGEQKLSFLRDIYILAEEIFQDYPHLFSGDDVYLWEDMARHWEGLGDLNKATRCLLNQAKLQPGKTDAWLNLGAMCNGVRMYGPAVAAYLQGLRFDPNDGYIKDNLNNILGDGFATIQVLAVWPDDELALELMVKLLLIKDANAQLCISGR